MTTHALTLLAGMIALNCVAQTAPGDGDYFGIEDKMREFMRWRTPPDKAPNPLIAKKMTDNGADGNRIRSFALVVGVSKYVIEDVEQLTPAAKDQQNLVDFLQAQEFDEIIVLRDEKVTKENLDYFLIYLRDQMNTYGPGARVLFAYSGHGVPEYLVMGNSTDVEDTLRNYKLTILETALKDIANLSWEFAALINSCHGGGIFNQSIMPGGTDVRPGGRGAHAMTATTAKDLAYALTPDSGSLFFDLLLKGITTGAADSGYAFPKKSPFDRGVVRLGMLAEYLGDETENQLPKNPLTNLLYPAPQYSSISSTWAPAGGFFFLGPKRTGAEVVNSMGMMLAENAMLETGTKTFIAYEENKSTGVAGAITANASPATFGLLTPNGGTTRIVRLTPDAGTTHKVTLTPDAGTKVNGAVTLNAGSINIGNVTPDAGTQAHGGVTLNARPLNVTGIPPNAGTQLLSGSAPRPAKENELVATMEPRPTEFLELRPTVTEELLADIEDLRPTATMKPQPPVIVELRPRNAAADFNPPDSYQIMGVDMSQFDKVDWDLLRKNKSIKFAYVRATTITAADKNFRTSWAEAKKSGWRVGAYHYFKSTHSAEDQFAIIKATMPKDATALPFALDIEPWNQKEKKSIMNKAEYTAAVLKLQKMCGTYFGKPAILYSRSQFFNEFPGIMAQSNFVWLAQYSPDLKMTLPNGQPWTLWQFSNPDIPGLVEIRKARTKLGDTKARLTDYDLNVFNGTVEQFNQFADGVVPAK